VHISGLSLLRNIFFALESIFPSAWFPGRVRER
jgi:hypothetical protein